MLSIFIVLVDCQMNNYSQTSKDMPELKLHIEVKKILLLILPFNLDLPITLINWIAFYHSKHYH